MNETDQSKPKQTHFGLVLLSSFVIFNLGYIVDQTIRWSNHLQGFMNGIFHIMVYGMMWCVCILPWSFLIFGLYRWRKWKRFRLHWVLAPAVLAFCFSVGSICLNPPTASNRFKRFAKTELPSNAENLHYRFSGGGIADYMDTYYFETSPEEVDRIIDDMNLAEDACYGREGLTHTAVSTLPDCPDFESWKDAKQYKGWDDRKHWFYYLIVDSSRTKVYMVIGCI
jgi:hypothetical protein